ncbi:uncharacterized protein LOC129595521 [Paramacrobiotus metropolitanus]|uniref:uncharacterized protein LOC129595521 n=1 Tax=Paramacrobiotus metropolitanus TaxID=2943436 RepID=UPI002445868D|nr:uncharacterized protein LOC129595521 [Paramacrobiotus metropolitanus]
MDTRWVTVQVFVFLFSSFADGFNYTTKNLHDECHTAERIIYLNCPTSVTGSAGTIIFKPETVANIADGCAVTVKAREGCTGDKNDEYAIYINIKASHLPHDSEMSIYDVKESSPKTLEKRWSGAPLGQNINPTSVGQTLSFWAREPALSVEYAHNQLSVNASHQVILDYVIVEHYGGDHNTWCHALMGYVSNEYICDTQDDRVSCPSRYTHSVNNMEPATDRQSCTAGLTGGEIAGIVIGSVIGVAILAGIAVACVKKSRKRTIKSNRKPRCLLRIMRILLEVVSR